MDKERVQIPASTSIPALTPEQNAQYQSELSVYRYAINSETQAILQVLFDQEATVREGDNPVPLRDTLEAVINFATSLGMTDCEEFFSDLFNLTGRAYPRLNQSKALVYILHKREQTALEIARVKSTFGMPIKDLPREEVVIQNALKFCEEKGLFETEEYIAQFMRMLIDRSCVVQEKFLSESR